MPRFNVRSSAARPILTRMDLATAAERLRSAFEGRDEIIFAYVFGSTAQGRTHARSDVDVAVYVEPAALQHAERDSAWGYPAEVTGVAMDGLRMNDVNVVILNNAPPLLSDRVARSGRLVLSRDEACRRRWVVQVKSRYCDLAPLRRLLRAALEERVRAARFGT